MKCPLNLRKMLPAAQMTVATRDCLAASLPRNASSGLEYVLQMGSLPSADLKRGAGGLQEVIEAVGEDSSSCSEWSCVGGVGSDRRLS